MKRIVHCFLLLACLSACGKTNKHSGNPSLPGGGRLSGLDGPASGGTAGAGGSAGQATAVEGVHVAIRKRARTIYSASGAFAGDALGVVAIALSSLTNSSKSILGIERESGFELVDLGPAPSFAPRIAPAPQGFFVAWSEESSLTVATIDVDGVEQGGIVASDVSPRACGLGSFEETAVVACESAQQAFALVCRDLDCERVELESCQSFTASPEVIWDGQAFAIIRACANPLGLQELRFTGLSRTGTVVTQETPLVRPWTENAPSSSMAVARRGDRLLLAYDDTLLEVEPTTLAVSVVADLGRPERLYGSRDYSLSWADGRGAIVDSYCDNGLERSHGDSAWRVLSDAGTELAAPQLVSESCGSVRLARSDSGRLVMLRGAPWSPVVEDLDTSSAVRGPAQLVAGPADESVVSGMACHGASCTLALFDPGIALSTSSSFHRVEVEDVASDGAVIPSTNRFVRSLLTPDGDTIVFDQDLSWLRPNLSVAWSQPLPERLQPAWDLGQPWAITDNGSSADLWRLSVTGPQKETVPIVAQSSICGTTHQTRPSADDASLLFEPLHGGGPSAPVSLPAGNRVVCGAGQIATYSDGAASPVIHRALASGTRLPDETLEGILVTSAADDALFFLTAEPSEGTVAAARYTLYELWADEPTHRQVLELPERGLPGTPSGLVQAPVHVQGGFIHLLWTSETLLMLSRWPRN